MKRHDWEKDKKKYISFQAEKYTCKNCGEKMNLNGLAVGNMPDIHYQECKPLQEA